MPWSVMDSEAFLGLSHPARSLLWEIARQFVRNNNGRLLASAAYLGKRGWTSNDTITRAKRELVEAGFIYETVMGHRPNRASWYAVTWLALDRLEGYDSGAVNGFKRRAYDPTSKGATAELSPGGGAKRAAIAPSRGVGEPPTAPPGGAIRHASLVSAAPCGGDHLEKPSAVRSESTQRTAPRT